MAGYNNRRWGFSPDEIRRPYTCLWMNAIDERIDGRVQPVISAGLTYIPTAKGNLYALRIADGGVAWVFAAGGPLLHSPTFHDGNLYFGCQDGRVCAVEAATGELLWSTPTGAGIWANPVVLEDRVLIGSRDKSFYALDRATGEILWKFATRGPIYNSPAYRDGRVLFASDDMHLYCLEARTGRQVWVSEKLCGQSVRDYWPVLVQDKVIVTTMPVMPRTEAVANDEVFRRLTPPGAGGNDNIPRDRERIAGERSAVIRLLWSDPARFRTHFVLDFDTGRETLRTSVQYQGSWGSNQIPPVVAPDGTIYTFFKSRFTPWMVPYTVGWYRDLGRLDLKTGRVESLIPGGGTYERQRALTDDSYHLHFVCDEHYCTSGGGRQFFVSWSDHGLGVIDLETNAALGGMNWRARPRIIRWRDKLLESEDQLPPDAGRHWTRISASAAVSGKYMVYKYWSTVYCFEGK